MGHPEVGFGFDLDGGWFVEGVVAEAAPGVGLGGGGEASGDGVAMDVTELFEVLGVGLDVEVVVAGEPEAFFAGGLEVAGGGLLQDLEDGG